jgi:acyl carrier protein phosphodiesterase
MYANLNGDFIKGNTYHNLPQLLIDGVILHRQIDDFIDTDQNVLNLKKTLSKSLPKVSAIAIDLYFDHLLAKKWKDYHHQELEAFLSLFYQHDLPHESSLHPNFLFLIDKIKSDRWINNYPHIEGLNFAATGLSKRISFPNALHKAADVFVENELEITNVFEDFIPKAILKFN